VRFCGKPFEQCEQHAGWPQTDGERLIPFHLGLNFTSHCHIVEGQVSRHCISRQ